MSAKKKKKTAGYNAAFPRRVPQKVIHIAPPPKLGTATLILTPKLIQRFGSVFRIGLRAASSLVSINDFYQEAITTSILPVTKSKSVIDFEDRAKTGTIVYAKQYDQILWECERTLGTSRFKAEYVRQLTQIDKELRNLPFASLDLLHLFRRHVVCCTNAAASAEDLFEKDSPKLHAVDFSLRTSNYGITALVLSLQGTFASPLWIMGELQRLTSEALHDVESMPEIQSSPNQLSGSLVFAEGTID